MAVKSYSLTTRQRLIDFLELENLTSTQKDVLDRIIDTTTEFVENYCGRRFKQTTYSNELYDGNDANTLNLDNYPVDSSSDFTLERRNSLANEDDWDTMDSEDYFVDYDAGIMELVKGLKFYPNPQHYRVSYTAGFDFDNSSTFLSDTEAGDLEYAVWRLGAFAWERRKGDPSVEKESIGDYSVTYRKAAMESDEVKAILDKYSSNSIAGMA